MMVAEGLGQSEPGHRASTVAIDAVSQYLLNAFRIADQASVGDQLFESKLKSALNHCQETLLREGGVIEAHRGMGAEVTVILICPNLRAAQIYEHPDLPAPRQRHLVQDLLAEARIDQVIQRNADDSFVVQTADQGSVLFRAGGNVIDEYGNCWTIDGDLTAVDATIDGERIRYGDYPNALERIWNGFADGSASLWVTAKLGHEFRIAETHTHAGGSHGSLHLLDSTSPFIAAGLPDGMSFPTNARTIDITPLCREVLGLD